MRNFQRKRKLGNILYAKPVLALFGVVVLFFAWGVIRFWGKMETTRENRKIAEDKVTELQQEKEKLSADIANLKTESGMEASIRDKFGLAKDGEGEIVIVEDKSQTATKNTSSGGFFSFLKNWFK